MRLPNLQLVFKQQQAYILGAVKRHGLCEYVGIIPFHCEVAFGPLPNDLTMGTVEIAVVSTKIPASTA